MHTYRCGSTADRNAMQQEAEKKLKYKSVCTEIQRMWNVKCMSIPLITGNNGLVTKGLKKNLEAKIGKHSIHYKRQLCLEHHI